MSVPPNRGPPDLNANRRVPPPRNDLPMRLPPNQPTMPMRAPPPGSRTPGSNGIFNPGLRSRLTHTIINQEQIISIVNNNLNVNDQLLVSLKNSSDALETLDLILAFRANIKRSLRELELLPIRSGGRGVMPAMIENKEHERELHHHPRLIPKNRKQSFQGPQMTDNPQTLRSGLALLPTRGNPPPGIAPLNALPMNGHLSQ
jgi:hypothetical protein